jgi:hypothetical protein
MRTKFNFSKSGDEKTEFNFLFLLSRDAATKGRRRFFSSRAVIRGIAKRTIFFRRNRGEKKNRSLISPSRRRVPFVSSKTVCSRLNGSSHCERKKKTISRKFWRHYFACQSD